jgi:ubiquinol-cytochrome c reductase cytochrome b subunit
LVLLHTKGSSNPLGIKFKHLDDYTFLYPYFIVKDAIGVLIILFFLVFFVGYAPNVLGHADNYILANALVTPTHIVPE